MARLFAQPPDRVNLLIHMIGVPAFIGGTLAAATQVLQAQWFGASVARRRLPSLAFAVQGIGHKRERVRAGAVRRAR